MKIISLNLKIQKDPLLQDKEVEVVQVEDQVIKDNKEIEKSLIQKVQINHKAQGVLEDLEVNKERRLKSSK